MISLSTAIGSRQCTSPRSSEVVGAIRAGMDERLTRRRIYSRWPQWFWGMDDFLEIAIAAAYRWAALMLRYCHPRLLHAPTLLARADEVIE
jgi:hypothetical protein